MEADQQDAADSTGGQSDGYSWEFSSDGRFDATENWRRIQSARIRNETAEEAEDQRTEPMSVARDMIAAQEDGGKAALRAAQILEERFKLWDRAEQDRRRQEFVTQVQEQFNYQAVEEDWYGVWCGGSEESPAESVVYISNLADCVTNEMLEGTFGQIGSVLAAAVEKAGCGWVEFERAEDVIEAVERFGGVVLAGQEIVCRRESVCENQTDY